MALVWSRDEVVAGEKANDQVMGVGRRRCETAAERQDLARRQWRARGNRNPGINLLPRRVANDEFEPWHIHDFARDVDDISFGHEDRHSFVLLGRRYDPIE